jgi:hypothetical protein
MLTGGAIQGRVLSIAELRYVAYVGGDDSRSQESRE